MVLQSVLVVDVVLKAALVTRKLVLQSVLKVLQAALWRGKGGLEHLSSLMALAIQTRAGLDVVRI